MPLLRMTVPVWVPGAKAPVVACKIPVPWPVPVPALRVNPPVFSLALHTRCRFRCYGCQVLGRRVIDPLEEHRDGTL